MWQVDTCLAPFQSVRRLFLFSIFHHPNASLFICLRFGITTILSTDNVRHLLRNYYPKDTHPVLYTSSYHAADAVPTQPGESASKKARQDKCF